MNCFMKYFKLLVCLFFIENLAAQPIPDTGISGVYEVMMGVSDVAYAKAYFADFGFSVVDSATLSAADALKLYGCNSAFKSYRLQNGGMDSHGLLRFLVWEKSLGEGVGDPLTHDEAMGFIRAWRRFSTQELTLAILDVALAIKARFQISYWDA